jgi:hypothetical protein
MSLLAAEPPKRQRSDDNGGSKKKQRTMTKNDAITEICADWEIVKQKRKIDKPYAKWLQNKDVVMALVKCETVSANVLKYLEKNFQDDPEVVLETICTTRKPRSVGLRETSASPAAIKFASARLQNDVEFARRVREELKRRLPTRATQIIANLDKYTLPNVLNTFQPYSKFRLYAAVQKGDVEEFRKQFDKQKNPAIRKMITMICEMYGTPTHLEILYFLLKQKKDIPTKILVEWVLEQDVSIFTDVLRLISNRYNYPIILEQVSMALAYSIQKVMASGVANGNKLQKVMTSGVANGNKLQAYGNKLEALTINVLALINLGSPVPFIIRQLIKASNPARVRRTLDFGAGSTSGAARRSFFKFYEGISYSKDGNFFVVTTLNRPNSKMIVNFNGLQRRLNIVKWYGRTEIIESVNINGIRVTAKDRDPSHILMGGASSSSASSSTSNSVNLVTDDSETESEEDDDDEDSCPHKSVLLPWIKKLIQNYSISREDLLKLLFDAVAADTVDIAEYLCTLLGGLSRADIDSSGLLYIAVNVLYHGVNSHRDYMLDVLLRFKPHAFTGVLQRVLDLHNDFAERIIKKFLDAGARPHINELIYAIGWLKANIVDLFLQPEYNLLTHIYFNSNGDTLLHFLGNRNKATSSRSSFIAAKRICQRLQTAGCGVNATNSSGQTPLSVAVNTIIRRVLIEAGGGGTISVESFRKLNLDHLLYNITLNTPETMIMFTDDTGSAVRCVPCKHVFGADFLQGWVKQNEADLTYDSDGQTYTLGLPARLKQECPICKRKIELVEFFSAASAAEWNRLEDAAKAAAKSGQEEIKKLEATPQFLQFMADAAKSESEEKVLKRKVEELEAEIKKAKEDAKKAAARKNQAKNNADNQIDTERARIRAAADAAEKAIRDKQILDGLKQLKF